MNFEIMVSLYQNMNQRLNTTALKLLSYTNKEYRFRKKQEKHYKRKQQQKVNEKVMLLLIITSVILEEVHEN